MVESDGLYTGKRNKIDLEVPIKKRKAPFLHFYISFFIKMLNEQFY